MTDAYIIGLRLRNAARVQCAIELLGDRWLLHPHNAVTKDEYREFRRSRAERIDTRVLFVSNPSSDDSFIRRAFAAGFKTPAEAFSMHAHVFEDPIWKAAPAGYCASAPFLLECLPSSEGGAQ
jgi:hypothetical protein